MVLVGNECDPLTLVDVDEISEQMENSGGSVGPSLMG